MLQTPHRFYQWSRREQNLFLICCGLLFLAIILFCIIALLFGWIWVLLFYPTIFILAQFIDTPVGQREGRLLYFSPLFLVEKGKDGTFTLHGGTLFDVLFVFNWQDRGEPARRKMITEFLGGLLAFTQFLKENNLDDVTIKGSSYFFSERNAQRYGFNIEPLNQGQKLILYINYVVILLTYSFTNGKLSRPPIGQTKSVQCTGKDLLAHQQKLSKTVARIQKHHPYAPSAH